MPADKRHQSRSCHDQPAGKENDSAGWSRHREKAVPDKGAKRDIGGKQDRAKGPGSKSQKAQGTPNEVMLQDRAAAPSRAAAWKSRI